jgi:hypothetical protein
LVNLIQPRVVLLSVKKTTPHHRTTLRQPRKPMFSMQPYFNPTRRNIENNLNIFSNGRRLQIFLKWKTTLNCSQMDDDLNFSFPNGIEVTPILFNGKQPKYLFKMEVD